ncbi:MAG TPA: recombinase family protein [Candidatus Coprenecus merdipullorum]|nr:recombinase family protein [Candidatus Coprenecus merdipullorum]
MIAGYLRVSTGKQLLTNQKEEILRYAAAKQITIDCWVTEIVSGKKNEKERKLGALLRRLKPGDILIVTEISRLSRTLTEIMEIMAKCLRKKIRLYTTKEGYSFDDSINSKVLCFAFGLVAEIERNLISMRTKEALAMRKANGVILGRRKGSCTKLNLLLNNKDEVLSMLRSQRTILDICRHWGVSRETFNKFRRLTPAAAELTARNNLLRKSGKTRV